MEIVSHVCAEFRDRKGLVILSIGPNLIRETLVVPDAIKEDPLFGLLVAEGSMKVFESKEDLREFEKDPLRDIDATGKKKVTKTTKTEKSGVKTAAASTGNAAADDSNTDVMADDPVAGDGKTNTGAGC